VSQRAPGPAPSISNDSRDGTSSGEPAQTDC
jgi:hypothetical protein